MAADKQKTTKGDFQKRRGSSDERLLSSIVATLNCDLSPPGVPFIGSGLIKYGNHISTKHACIATENDSHISNHNVSILLIFYG